MSKNTRFFSNWEKIISSILIFSSIMVTPGTSPVKPGPSLVNQKNTTSMPAIRPFFIKNNGQSDSQISYYLRGKNNTLILDEKGNATFKYSYSDFTEEKSITNQVFGIKKAEAADYKEISYIQKFNGTNRDTKAQADKKITTKLHFFQEEKQIKEVPAFEEISFNNIYNGIDLIYKTAENNSVKYDMLVHPGANPRIISFSFDGVDNINIDKNGDLQLAVGSKQFSQKAPYVYQNIEGKQIEIASAYKLLDNKNIGFDIDSYNKNYDLIIDPTFDTLTGSTFLGGSDDDEAFDVAYTSSNIAYVVGQTKDATTDMQTNGTPYNSTQNGDDDIFIAKFSSNFQALDAMTFIGTSSQEGARGVGVDSNGKVFITGFSRSDSYPTAGGAYSSGSESGGTAGIVVSRFSSNLSSLEASTRFGGSDHDYSMSIHVGSSDKIFFGGYGGSSNLPVTTGVFQTSAAGSFVGKLSNDLTSLEKLSYLGSTTGGLSQISDIVEASSGSIFAVGVTGASNFPTTNSPYDSILSGTYDMFISKISADFTSLQSSTLLGGTGDDEARAVAIDTSGNVYVAGYAQAAAPTTTSAYQETYQGSGDGYIAKLNSTLQDLSIGTYLGGSGGSDVINEIVLDSSNVVYVTGFAYSGFPTTTDAYDTSQNGGTDAFVSKLTANLQSLSGSSFLGGSSNDFGNAIKLDSSESSVILVGGTEDGTTDFPTSVGAYDTTHNGGGSPFGLSGEVFATILTSSADSVPEFSFYVYMATLLWGFYLIKRKKEKIYATA